MNLDFSNLRILVYGDVMLDEYVHGVIERISPEAPVPVLSRTHSEYRPGGAANVAANVAALGAEVALVAPVGIDNECARLFAALPNKIDTFLVAASLTTHKTRYVGQRNHQMLRVDVDGGLVNEDSAVAVINNITSGFDAIIVSDYAKGAVTPKTFAALRAKGVPIFVDPKQNDWSIYAGASYLTPNEKEWQNAIGRCAQARGVLCTRGERGMSLIDGDKATYTNCDAVAQQVADVTGAGDTVIAAFTSAIMSGNDPVESMRFANVCAGIAVSKSGTATVSIAEARAAFNE